MPLLHLMYNEEVDTNQNRQIGFSLWDNSELMEVTTWNTCWKLIRGYVTLKLKEQECDALETSALRMEWVSGDIYAWS